MAARISANAIPQSRTLMRGLILGDKYAKDAAEELVTAPVGTGPSALAALKDANALWTVEKQPIFAHDERDGFLPIPGFQRVARTDTGRTLGIVSPRYAPYQNEAMGTWADLLVDVAETEHVAAVEINGGQKVMLLMKLRPSQFAAQIGDDITPTMVVGTGHDGGTSLGASTMAFRQLCANTLHWSIPGLTRSVRIRHTMRMDYQVQEAQRALNLATSWAEGFDAEIERLLDETVLAERVDTILEGLWPVSEDEDIAPRTRTNNELAHAGVWNALADIDESFRFTGWGFMNALTDYEQWDRAGTTLSGPERHLRSLATGGTDRLASRARRLVLAN